MSSECNHDCSSCGSDCSDRNAPQSFLAEPHPMSSIKKIIGVVSGKGGVGKSLVTELLAVGMNRRGRKTGILDADITGPSIPKAFGLDQKAHGNDQGILPATTKTGIDIMSINLLLENTSDPVIWRGPVIAGAVKQFYTDVVWADIDTMFVDMPPGTGDVPLTVFQSLPVDGIIVVTSPQELVSMIVEKAVKMARMMNIPVIGIVENMSYAECPDCGRKINVFGESHINEIALSHGLSVLGRLPIDPALAAMVDAGDIENFDKDWLTPALDAIEALG